MTQTPTHSPPKPMLRGGLFLVAAATQLLCGLIFLGDLIGEYQHLTFHSMIEALGVIGLAFGATLTLREYRRLAVRNRVIQRELDAASGAFHQIMQEHFDQWGLTAAERDVALLSIKGMSNAEIADIRKSAVGTIKAQSHAVYRKAGVSTRAELISFMVEDIIAGVHPDDLAAGA